MNRWLSALALLLSACVYCSDELVEVSAVGGSNDHRIFRIGSVTKLMMEPVLWKLEDTHRIDFDRPVTDYFKDPLPPEYSRVTLRQLHDNRTGLPREFLDSWSLGDVGTALGCGLIGTHLYAGFDTRADFVDQLWLNKYRSCLRHDGARYSNMGYALLMMAITDATGMSQEQLCQEYLVKPYGLVDTAFELKPGMRNRLTKACAGSLPWLYWPGWEVDEHREGEIVHCVGGMYSSAHDILRVAYVILPHLKRARGLLCEERLPCGRQVFYRTGMIYGGKAFLGFDPKAKRAVVILRNQTEWPGDEGFELMEALVNPPS